MNGMVEIFKKNFLVFCKFISFCKLTDFTGKYYDIDEYREYFMKKSLDLCNMETKQLPSQSISMDFTYLMFFDIQLEHISCISIEDVSNGITKSIPYKYQLLNSALIKNKYDVLSVKIFSEVETPVEIIDKSKMIKSFNEAFGRNTYYLYGNYNLYIIDTIGSVLYEEDT
ncbi:hypothetical protein CWI36_3011p0010, partial [Hamiltosporidium magnivora]